MNQLPAQCPQGEPPAMGERRARWGYGYQDKVATERILGLLRKDIRDGATRFEGVRLADLAAGRVDDFVLVCSNSVEGNSIKWSGEASPLNWGDLIGASGLLRELADGYQRLCSKWPGRAVSVRLQSNRPASVETYHAQIIKSISVAEFLAKYWPLGPIASDSPQSTEAWSKIAEHVGMTDTRLSQFVSSCELALGRPAPPGDSQDKLDWRHYEQQFDRLHKAIATWLANTPDGEFIDRAFLLSAIGFRVGRSGLIQRFPEPKIPYEKNQTAADRLKERVGLRPGQRARIWQEKRYAISGANPDRNGNCRGIPCRRKQFKRADFEQCALARTSCRQRSDCRAE